jgi:hypothetical protein
MNATSSRCLGTLIPEPDPSPYGGNDGHRDDHHPRRVVNEVGVHQEDKPSPKLRWSPLSLSIDEKDKTDTAHQKCNQ